MIETHPFHAFVPQEAQVLILGSFPGKESTQQQRQDDWYYGANRNQFWKILEIVYKKELRSLKDKQTLFAEYGIAITDIIKSCKRANNSASDKNLTEKIYNTDVIKGILANNAIEKILFTSKGVEEEFTAHIEPSIPAPRYRKVVLITPSAAYRRESIEQKAEKYRKELPHMTSQEARTRMRDRFGDADGLHIIKNDHR
jgi:hypoxanthine-DNA glycosylase